VDLRSGRFAEEVPAGYEQRDAAKDAALSTDLGDADIAKIGRRAHYAEVYLVGAGEGEGGSAWDKVILPVHGYGLWSTLYGFVALESDANTIAGLGFYEHGETPGLGGEVDNPRWKAQWPGKQAYRDGDVEIALLKGAWTAFQRRREVARRRSLRGNPDQPRRDQPDAVLARRERLWPVPRQPENGESLTCGLPRYPDQPDPAQQPDRAADPRYLQCARGDLVAQGDPGDVRGTDLRDRVLESVHRS
jgi:hypothetical protein